MSSLFSSTPASQETASLFINEKFASARTKIIDWLNECNSGGQKPTERCETIKKIQELILHSDEELLEEFLENILSFGYDPVQEVKRCMVSFVEEMSKHRVSFIPRTITVLTALLRDESPQVIKRVIQGLAAIYKNFLQWICTLGDVSDETKEAWDAISIMKAEIVDMIDNFNDGIRTNAIKFLEGVVIQQTYTDEDSMKRDNDFSLDSIPLTTKIVRRRKLEDEANSIFAALLKFYAASHISSVNLIACTGTLCTIAKMRPNFLSDVVQALKNRHSNLPPTLSDSQMNSVRKHLKMQLLNILRQPAAFELQSMITHVLIDLGSSNSEIAKAIPKMDKKEQVRRTKRALENAAANAAKRIKIEAVERPVRREMEIDQLEVDEQKRRSNRINETFVAEHLSSRGLVAELIMESMQNLPNEMPAHFLRNYVTEPTATLEQRSQKIAKQLAELMTAERLGPGAAEITKVPPMKPKSQPIAHEPMEVGGDQAPDAASSAAAEAARKEEATKKLRETMERAKSEQQTIMPRLKQKAKTLKLEEITKQLPKAKKETMLVQSVGRILNAERKCIVAGVANRRKRFLAILASSFTVDVRDAIANYIKRDFVERFDLAEMWLYEEYSLLQGFARHAHIKTERKADYAYNRLIGELVEAIVEQAGNETFDHEKYLRRIYLSAPLLTDDVSTSLVAMCEFPNLSSISMRIIRDLAIQRPPKRAKYVNVLLQLAMHENVDMHEKAQQNLVVIYSERQLLRDVIEAFALRWLGYLEQEQPPQDIFKSEFGRTEAAVVWTEPLAKMCLSLFLLLLQHNDALLGKLSEIYIKTSSEMKRTILRSIDAAVKKLGPDNDEILKLIETGARGTETLIIRVIYILTERAALTPSLVKHVRDLYYSKVADVRLLIPIITGLSKQEVLTMLPKVLVLSPIVVKEVFNRLLGLGADFEHIKKFPLTPVELLVALHTLDPNKVSLKFVVKATSMCLAEKERYTHDVLAIVLQQLIDMTPLPTLSMRTILQSHSLYPRLSTFIINLMSRMIQKQVWRQKVLWEGFLKCCQRLKPASFPVMLALPPQQLRDALNTCPELRQPMLEHANEMVEKQTGPISKVTMDILHGNSEDIFITDVSENFTAGLIAAENIKKEKDDAAKQHQPLPPGDDR